MFEALISSILVFLATECDDFLLYVILFTNYSKPKLRFAIFTGQLTALLCTSLLCAFASVLLSRIPQYYTGFLGIIPFILGIKALFDNDSDDDRSKTDKNITLPFISLFTLALSVTFSADSDNISVYIPYFVSVPLNFKVLTILIFILMQCLWSFLQIKASDIPFIKRFIKGTGTWLIPAVLCALGVWIIIKTGTFRFTCNLLLHIINRA